MDRNTKILLGGVVIAASVVGIGYAASRIAYSHVSDLAAQCESQNARTTTSKSQVGWVPLVCDPEILMETSVDEPKVGIQTQMIDTQLQGERWHEQATVIAIDVLVFSAIPYAWYFIPRRVRELHDAIAGK